MKMRYTFTLLTLLMAVYFVPAIAQTKSTTKKTTTKTVQKPAAKPAAKTTKKVAKGTNVQQKTSAKNLGDAASKTTADTTKKGGVNNPANGGSLSEEIVVTTNYKPVLAEAVKIRRNPDLEDKTPFKAPLQYAPIDKRLDQDNNIRQLEAMKRPAEQDSALLNNYAKVGLGSMKTTFAEAYFGNGRDEALQVGGFVKHFAQSGSALEKQNDSRQEVGVFGKTIVGDNSISGRINYNRRGTYFYGYDQINPPTTPIDIQKQTFNKFGAEGEIAKNYKDVENDFTYAVKLKGYTWSNAFEAKENNVVLSGFLNQTVNQFYAGLSASVDLANQKDALYDLNNSLLRLNPYIKFQGDNYKIDAGVNIVKEFGFSSRFFIFPAAKLELQVIPKYVRLFAEAKGNVNRTSLSDFSAINPFLGQNINITNSVDQLDISVGLKGTLAPGLGFKATAYRNSVKNMPLIVNNFANEFNKFTLIYDDGKARISGFNGELDFKASEDVNVYGRVEFKDYKLASEAQPWNLPKLLITAGTTIHINDKVDVNGSLLFRGAAKDRPILAGGTVPVNIASFADMSGGANYKVNKQLSVFVQANNILNTTSRTWVYYPNYGFNIFGGVGYAF
jgi:outer membrane receptor protein involved in Fe transport